MTDKPTIDLNLDTLAKEAGQEPFTIVWHGSRYTLAHAGALNAFDLFAAMALGEPDATIQVLRLALGETQLGELKKAGPPIAALKATVRQWFAHSGMGPDDVGN